MSMTNESTGKVSPLGLLFAAVFFTLAIVTALAYFFAPLPDWKKEELAIERWPGLTIQSEGKFSSLPHERPMEFEEFKKIAGGGHPFLEAYVSQPCIKRSKKGACTDYGNERATVRYSVLSPSGDGSWVISFPKTKFSRAGPWLEFFYAWDVDYDEDKVALVRSPLHIRHWIAISTGLVFFMISAALLTWSLPTPPKEEWRTKRR